MIYTNDKLLHTNVYTKTYVCPYQEMGRCMTNFVTHLQKANVRKKEDIFYTFLKINEDASVTIKLFVSAQEYCDIPDDGFQFHSYFVLEQMLSTVVLNDFEHIESHYANLMIYAEANGLEITSNIYTTLHAMEEKRYFIIKASVHSILTEDPVH